MIDLLVLDGANVNQPHHTRKNKTPVTTYPLTVAASCHAFDAVKDLVSKGRM